jgi:DNA-binding transcriptional LysR family regulator
MDLQKLEHFVVVAEERHFTRAAVRCHIAQSALSTSIQGLERALGAPLFDRTTRRVELTELGRVLLPEARTVLAAADAAHVAVAQCLGRVRGHLSVGRVWGAIGEVISTYHERFPEVEVTLKQGLSAALIEDVRTGHLDVAFVGLHPRGLPTGVRVVTRRSLPVGIACATGHPLARLKAVALDDLSGEAFVGDPGDTATHDGLRAFFSRAGVDYRVVFKVADIASMLDLIANGLAVALLPRSATKSWPGIAHIPLAGASPSTDAGLIAADVPTSAAVQAFLDVVDANKLAAIM